MFYIFGNGEKYILHYESGGIANEYENRRKG